MKNAFLTILIAFIVLIIVVFGLVYFMGLKDDPTVTTKNTDNANEVLVEVLQGDVYYKNVDTNNVYLLLEKNKYLGENTWIKTDLNSKAQLNFGEGIYAVLSENTEVLIKEFLEEKDLKTIELEQTSGSIWHRIMKIFGSADYSVEVGDVIASVRGTGFFTDIDNNNSTVSVHDGNVEVLAGEKRYYVTSGYKVQINRNLKTATTVVENVAITEIINKDKENDGSLYNKDGVKVTNLGSGGFIDDSLAIDNSIVEKKKEELRQEYSIQIGVAQSTSPEVTDNVIDEYLDIAVKEGADKAKQMLVEQGIDIGNYIK
ncbi:MAG: FecR domain-containing protein [Candidatus ainarchaeum sp.]|nr:FecR domain-containing protein [Candidatus ainarchaeum sp.]